MKPINTLATLKKLGKAQQLITDYLNSDDASCDGLGDAHWILEGVMTDVLLAFDPKQTEENTNDED